MTSAVAGSTTSITLTCDTSARERASSTSAASTCDRLVLLRMPEHAEREAALGRLDRLDHVVVLLGPAGGDEPAAEPVDALMMV